MMMTTLRTAVLLVLPCCHNVLTIPQLSTWEQAPVGNTPLIDLTELEPKLAAGVRVFGKAEFVNPSGSIKDRIVQFILDEHERTGRLVRHSGQTIVAASSGNTAAALAMFSAMRGYHCVLITNRKTSTEKVQQLHAFGAEVIVTASGVPISSAEHYQNVEKRLCKENPSWLGLNQYDNPLNPQAYYASLGPELWAQTNGTLTHFVAAGSTGGTVSGTARFLKEQSASVRVLMPDPMGSIFYDMWKHERLATPRSFEVEGVGKDSIPLALNLSCVDEMPRFNDRDAFTMCRTMARSLGVMVGGSAGGNVFAALELARSIRRGPAVIVAILCDSGTKYLSKIFNDEWMRSKGYLDERTDDSRASGPRHTGGPTGHADPAARGRGGEVDTSSWDEFKVGSLGDTSIL